jgi:hypothetical protein
VTTVRGDQCVGYVEGLFSIFERRASRDASGRSFDYIVADQKGEKEK